MQIDMWYGDKLESGKYGADAYFNSQDGRYYGNIYDGGKIIGDYVANNSVEIERVFCIEWGE